MSFTLPLPYEMVSEICEYRGVSVNRDIFNGVMYQFKKYADEADRVRVATDEFSEMCSRAFAGMRRGEGINPDTLAALCSRRCDDRTWVSIILQDIKGQPHSDLFNDDDFSECEFGDLFDEDEF